jgi:hypothetical protein
MDAKLDNVSVSSTLLALFWMVISSYDKVVWLNAY